MAFDSGWDFRATAPFVTDPPFAAFASTEAYPFTYTNGNGLSVNGGWTTPPVAAENEVATWDPRIAGRVRYDPGNTGVFQVDLNSGSAPGPGTYLNDVAFGVEGPGGVLWAAGAIKDNGVTIIDVTNGGAGFSDGDNHFRDAMAADVIATVLWTGAQATKAFSSNLAQMVLTPLPGGDFHGVAHFRITLVPPAPPSGSPQGAGGGWEELPRRIPRVPRLPYWLRHEPETTHVYNPHTEKLEEV